MPWWATILILLGPTWIISFVTAFWGAWRKSKKTNKTNAKRRCGNGR